MPTLLLRDPLAPAELRLLHDEFPQYNIRLSGESITDEEWAEVEILYGGQLDAEELDKAPRLRWIHLPSAITSNLCLAKIHTATNLVVTATKSPDVYQTAEYVIGALLASAKELPFWSQSRKERGALWESPHRSLLWSLKGRTLVQVGLSPRGLAIADYATRLGMRVLGVTEHKTFHPYCHKNFDTNELSSLLPNADAVSILPPIPGFNNHDLTLIREGAIVVLLGLEGIDLKLLEGLATAGRFRHLFLDAPPTFPAKSPLWDHPDVTLTPAIAPCPETEGRLAFHQFQFNLRRYIHSDFDRMRNHV
ncbi:MAG: NAD(P)-dependent oxidoreductase [Parachlamydiales bacterium]